MESLHSKRNRFFWKLRSALGFRRPGYKETGDIFLELTEEESALERRYGLTFLKSRLAPEVYRKNLATLWIMEKTLPAELLPGGRFQVVEAGCQDFSRLPAIRAFFAKHGREPVVMGIELDPFPVLSDFHSRADKAEYYLSLPGASRDDDYLAGDFFRFDNPASLILSFYPFVSPDPALAWGIPAEFGDGRKWAEAYVRNLQPGGLVLVVHQGTWEEEEFDRARKGAPLEIIWRSRVDCPFYPQPHPACASVYRRLGTTSGNLTH
jgi:hypothetical protein